MPTVESHVPVGLGVLGVPASSIPYILFLLLKYRYYYNR
jgi:uncharacterized membrane protein YbaN (DUF454 family)